MTLNSIQHYATISRSPLLLAPIIEAFFEELSHTKNGVLLAYLVLPLVLNPATKDFLVKAKSTSSLRTFSKDRTHLSGLPARVEEFRSICNVALQNSINCGRLTIDQSLSVQVVLENKIEDPLFIKEKKAAKRLAIFFEPYEVVTIFRILGVNNL